MENNTDNLLSDLPVLDNKTVLLVEDDESYRKYTQKVLEKFLKCKVITTTNPKEAFDYLNNNIPDLIIMDLQMPYMDGLTALKYIRASERTNKVPVIICSALGFESIIHTMSNLGVNEFIVKPADVQTLIKKVTKVINSEHS